MSVLLFDRRLRNPRMVPTGPVRVNRGHPLAQNLSSLLILGHDLLDRGSFGYTMTGAAPIVGSSFGPARDVSAIPATNISTFTSAGTIAWRQYSTSVFNAGTTRGIWGHSTVPADSPSCQIFSDNNWYVGWNASGDQRVLLAASSTNAPQATWIDYALVWNASGTQFYASGVLIGSNATAPVIINNTTSFLLGSYGTAPSFGGYMSRFATYLSALSTAEIAVLSAAPFSMLESAVPLVMWDVGASGGIFSVSVAEGMSLLDAPVGAAIMAPTLAETMAFTDAVSGAGVFGAAQAEVMTLADAPSAVGAFGASLAEAMALVDSASTGAAVAATQAVHRRGRPPNHPLGFM